MLDLGIPGRKAIVCAASKGLGRACAMALGPCRGRARDHRADRGDARGRPPRTSAGDRRQGHRRRRRHHDRGRAPAALAACPKPDILVNNCGGPPHGDFREWAVEDWQKAVNANMLTPIMLIKATVDGMSSADSAASSTSPRGR